MSEDDIGRRLLGDIQQCVSLLTRLPSGLSEARNTPDAAWAFPVVGAILGVLASIVADLALWLSLGPVIAAVLCVAALIVMTGGLHEDGLADSADGLWGGWTKQRRLEIMKDSQIGSYGVLALGVTLLLRVTALSLLFSNGFVISALVVTGAVSRAPMAMLMAVLPNARSSGLSHLTGRPRTLSAWHGIAIAGALALLLTGGAFLSLILFVTSAALAVAKIATAKIEGQTGDILGATQQICEVAALLTLVACLV